MGETCVWWCLCVYCLIKLSNLVVMFLFVFLGFFRAFRFRRSFENGGKWSACEGGSSC